MAFPDRTVSVDFSDQPHREETWVLLWSQSQNALHIEPLSRMLHANQQALQQNRRSDYVLICLGERDQVDRAAANCRHTLHEREADRRRREL
ncbi:hypothetical protein [uncultured Pseudacidovorax sp.]|uniref:hypothetical protein n=1 Tax=uncultured Pseudacidovorax sp. TaxID=679313 RepID=UPI0025E446DC|nr:hypothetical protein [uncultured Pseudacidovorax sp.]